MATYALMRQAELWRYYTMKKYELMAHYDSRKSFYGKAVVIEENNTLTLFSYDTKVAEIKDSEVYIYNMQSQTTLRHIKEFLKQNDFVADNKKQLINDYKVVL